MKKIILLFLFCVPVIAQSNLIKIDTKYKFARETLIYLNRVRTDGGVVINLFDVDKAIKHAKANGYYSNITCWFSAQFGVKKNGSNAITKLYDLSPSGNDATGTGTWVANTRNGRASIVFNGTTDYFAISGTPLTYQSTAYSVISVANITDTTANRTIIDFTNRKNTTSGTNSILYRNIYLTSTNKFETRVRDSVATTNFVSTNNNFPSVTVIGGIRNGSAVTAYRNMVRDSIANTNTIGTLADGDYYFTIGAVRNGVLPSGGSFMKGNIYDVILLNTNISEPVYETIANLLNIQYGSLFVSLRINDQRMVLLKSVSGWDSGRLLAPDIIKSGDTYYMFYSGSSTTSYPYRIGVATSSDGVSWTKYAGNPVLDIGSGGSYDDLSLLDAHVLKIDTTWFMYYNAVKANSTYRVAYATSNDLLNWTKQDTVLGRTVAWEDSAGIAPNFVGLSGGIVYLCYYNYNGASSYSQTGLATSADGISFTKSANNPIIRKGITGQYDANNAEVLALIRDPSTFEIQSDNGFYYGLFDVNDQFVTFPLKWKISAIRSGSLDQVWDQRTMPVIKTNNLPQQSYGAAGPSLIVVGSEIWVFYETLDGITNEIARIVIPNSGLRELF